MELRWILLLLLLLLLYIIMYTEWIPNLSKAGRKTVNHRLTETIAPILIPRYGLLDRCFWDFAPI